MKRFWDKADMEAVSGGFRVTLDGRPIKTQGGVPQVVPSAALAQELAAEWQAQGAEIDPQSFPLRDMADFAIDHVQPDRTGTIEKLLRYAETDTLCYRADPDEPLFAHQRAIWEPIITTCEARHALHFERVSGIVHRAQPAQTLAKLQAFLETQNDFTLAALATLVPLGASLIIGLAALADDAEPAALFAAANCEEDWQAQLWGRDAEAERNRALRLAAFEPAVHFIRLIRD